MVVIGKTWHTRVTGAYTQDIEIGIGIEMGMIGKKARRRDVGMSDR